MEWVGVMLGLEFRQPVPAGHTDLKEWLEPSEMA